MTADRTSDTLTRGAVTYQLIEQRGGIRLMDAGPNEPLPYAIFDPQGVLLARLANRLLATWLMNCLEED